MGNPQSQASKQRTAVMGIPLVTTVVLVTLLSVAALSLGDLMKIFPLFAPLVASPFFPFFHEIHDLLAVAVALYAAYKYHVRLGVVAILLYLITHIPYIVVEFTEDTPEILRILFGGFIALLGIWLINQLQKSQKQMEERSQEARKERRFSQNVIATVPESLLVLDKNLRIKSANRSFYQLFQTNPENTIGRKLPDVLWDEGGKLATELSRLFGTEDTLDNFELRYQSERLGEKIFYITARGIIVAEEEEEEEEEEELVVIRDITERKQAEEALMRTEENFRRSLEDSPLGVSIVNEDGETVYANRAMLDIYGYTGLGELKATSASERYTPDSYAEHQVRKKKRQRGKYVPSNYEISIVRKNGEIRHLEVFRKEVLWNGHTQFQVLYNDATERKRAVEKLRESEEKYRSLFANMMNGLAYCKMIFDEDMQPVDFTYVEVNDSFERLTGLRKDDVVGKRVTEVIPSIKTLNPEIITIYGQVVLTGKPTAFEVFFKPLNIWLAIWVYSPREGYFVAVFDNITESKQAEKVLEESEARYRSLVHLGAEVGEAIVMLQDEGEREGLQAFCNEAWPRITGYSDKQLLNMSFFDLVHPKDREASLLRHRRKMSGEGIPGLYEVTIIRKDGSEVFVELTSAWSTYQGKPTNVAYIRDITERKQMYEQLVAQDRLASIGQMVSGVAHEINNPLTGVIGFSELLLKRDLPDDVKADLKVVNDEAMRTAKIVKNLLTFARKQPEEKALVDINEQIQRVLDLRDHEQKVNNINVNTRFASDLPQIMGNGSQLQQVFFNIVINAEFFMLEAHQKGNLTITTKRIGDFLRCSLADDGPGISEKNMKNLFIPFFTTKEVGKGTGLGLSICYGIITEHGGRIYAESTPKKGATFVVELPIKEETTSQVLR